MALTCIIPLHNHSRVFRFLAAILFLCCCCQSVWGQVIPECDAGFSNAIWAQVGEGETCRTDYTCSALSPPVQVGQEPKWMYIHHVGGTADIGADVVISGPVRVPVTHIQGGYAISGIITDIYRVIADGIPEGDEYKGCYCSLNPAGPDQWDMDSPVRILDLDGWTVKDVVAAEADGVMPFVLEFANPVARDITIAYYTGNGTALAGQDYTTTAGEVTVRSGTRTANISVPIIQDQIVEAPETFNLLTKSAQFTGVGTLTAVGTIVGSPFLVLDPDAITVQEGRFAGYTVSLGEQPSGNVTVVITEDQSNLLAFDNSPDRLTFTPGNWNQVQAIYVTAKQDDDIVGDVTGLIHTASGGGYGGVIGYLPVTIEEDDVPGIVLTPTRLEIQEGQAGTYTVALAIEPSVDVTVHIFDVDGIGVLLSVPRVHFTAADWFVPQEVTITTHADSDEDDEVTVIHHVAFEEEYRLVHSDLPLRVKEVEEVEEYEIMVSPMRVSVDEGASGMVFSVWLSLAPCSPVRVRMELNSALVGKVSVAPAEVVFSPTDWGQPRVVTVVGLEDDDAVDESGYVRLRAHQGAQC